MNGFIFNPIPYPDYSQRRDLQRKPCSPAALGPEKPLFRSFPAEGGRAT